MVKYMEIFNIKNLLRVVAVVAVCAMSVGAHAEYSGGDDDDDYNDCQYFSPAYALCTVHSYNAGMAKSPTDASQAAEMNRIIALKSTVIAQQMKQQYDVLNAMVKRFKTQLEKAVLTSKMEVLTGNASGSSSSGGSSSANNNGLAEAEDCGLLDKANIYDCLLRNLGKVEKAADKNIGNARKQLQNDMEIAHAYKMCNQGDNTSSCQGESKCRNIGNKQGLVNCVKALRYSINNAKADYEDSRAKNRNPWGN
jgi:hypothetical protein